MRVIVPIKQILDPSGFTVHRRLERIFINREEYIINPNDKNALEEALRLKDAQGAEVIAISLGEARADDALREALAMGADQAFLLTDEAFDEVDAAAAALILGKAIEKIGHYDLILTGQRAFDTGASQIGPRLAEYLDLPQILDVRQITAINDSKLRAKRNWRGGYAEVEVGLPVLLTIAPEANEPRYPPASGIISAYREREVTTWGAADLGLAGEDLSPLIGIRRQAFPPERTFGELIAGAPDEAAKELAQILKTRN